MFSCYNVNFGAFRKFWPDFGAMYKANMKGKEVSWISASNRVQRVQSKYPLITDFPRSLPISLLPWIVGYFSPLRKVLGTRNRVQRVQWKYTLITDFPLPIPISQSPFIVGNFSPLRKVLGTRNRVQRVQWKYTLITDFPRSLPIYQSPCIVGNFSPLGKYSECETASKECNESTHWLPIFLDRCRFLCYPV